MKNKLFKIYHLFLIASISTAVINWIFYHNLSEFVLLQWALLIIGLITLAAYDFLEKKRKKNEPNQIR